MSVPISIIVCTRNRVGQLCDTLRSIGALTIPTRFDPELVVVDNGSTDGTWEALSHPPVFNMPVRRVRESTPGVAWARNAAIRAAEGRILPPKTSWLKPWEIITNTRMD